MKESPSKNVTFGSEVEMQNVPRFYSEGDDDYSERF